MLAHSTGAASLWLPVSSEEQGMLAAFSAQFT